MSSSPQREYKIDLQEHIEKYAWRRYREDHPIKSLFCRKSQYYVDIRWGFVDFQHKTVHFTPRKAGQDEPKEKNLELYSSEYENRTPSQQSYMFSTKRETTASATFQIEETYSIGGSANLEVNIGVATFGGSADGSMSITNTDSETFSETLGWNIDTTVMVPSFHKATAKLQVSETATSNDFEIKTTVKLPKDVLPISIRRISDDKVLDSRILGKLPHIFEDRFLEKNKSIIKPDSYVDENNKKWTVLILTTRGVCKVRTTHNQHVEVNSEPMPDAPESVKKEFEKSRSGATFVSPTSTTTATANTTTTSTSKGNTTNNAAASTSAIIHS